MHPKHAPSQRGADYRKGLGMRIDFPLLINGPAGIRFGRQYPAGSAPAPLPEGMAQPLAALTVGEGFGNRAGRAEFAASKHDPTLTAIAQPIQLEESS